jgi:hypothetical protein
MVMKLICWGKHTFIVWSAYACFKLMIISCAKHTNSCIPYNRYSICTADCGDWGGGGQGPFTGCMFVQKQIVNGYEGSGEIVVFVSGLMLTICLY